MGEKGINLRGMNVTEHLDTVYDSATGKNILRQVQGYEDKVLLGKFMSLNNDGATIEAIGNYSDAGLGRTSFVIKPSADQIMMIARLMITVADDGSFDSGAYGNGIILTNGITATFRIDGTDVFYGFDPQFPIKKNPDWSTICYDVRVDSYGSGEEYLSARYSYSKHGKYLRLDGSKGEEFAINFNDDFTGLVAHRFLCEGYYEQGAPPVITP